MCKAQDNVTACLREATRRVTPARFAHEMDQGLTIRLRVEVNCGEGSARIDFADTSAPDPHNFNAPRAAKMAAVLHVLRAPIDLPISLHEKCMAPLQVIEATGNPRPSAAVAAGNVETSRRVVGAHHGALGVMAARWWRRYLEGPRSASSCGPGTHGCRAMAFPAA
jgi:5-oxoprolinase (ATP-hydrolysing)